MNTVMLSGHAGGEPEFKTVGSNGTELATVGLAVNRYRGPNKDDATDWYRLQFWGAKTKIAKYIGKGDKVAVVGEIALNKWQTDEGQDRITVQVDVSEVELMGSRSDDTNAGGFDDAEEEDFDEDDLPF